MVNGQTKTTTITYETNYVNPTTIAHKYTIIGDLLPASYKITTVSNAPAVYGNSTKTATGNPLYIDLDIGEAWNEDGGEPLSLNNAVQLPAELPTLPTGATEITYDNTFTSFDIVPRWWKV